MRGDLPRMEVTVPRRKIRDEEEARACLAAVARSGLPRAAWARANGFDGRSLNGWRVALERRDRKQRQAAGLAELVPVHAPASERRSELVVQAGGLRVVVPRDFEEDHLLRVLRVVAAC